jgi:transcription elongation factor Elf1
MDKKFFCEACNYKTNIKIHWDKHLKTKKHNNMLKCEICNLQLSSKSSYYRHKKVCNGEEIIKKIDILYEKIIELESRLKSCEDNDLFLSINMLKK